MNSSRAARIRPPADENPHGLFRDGLHYLKRNDVQKAMTAFESAFRQNPADPKYMSYLGLCRVLLRKDVKVAVALCEKAAKQSIYDPDVFHNLGRVYLERGNRKKALKALMHGLQVDAGNQGILQTLTQMKTRGTPPITFLPRNHPLNYVLGKFLARLGLR
jgi:tetratricopeptide (TPR) repeat protein